MTLRMTVLRHNVFGNGMEDGGWPGCSSLACGRNQNRNSCNCNLFSFSVRFFVSFACHSMVTAQPSSRADKAKNLGPKIEHSRGGGSRDQSNSDFWPQIFGLAFRSLRLPRISVSSVLWTKRRTEIFQTHARNLYFSVHIVLPRSVNPDYSCRVCQARASPRCVSASGFRC